ncbi:hypothetical protein [Nonomuraea sp. NPDC050783]|uniref:hypothetical protein n=1 Tax=Nonomuraea sp. NPDC050783 TaxID=3154634 RepID=UPI003467C767
MASFVGLRPWSTRGPEIEFEADGGSFDLHNNARVERLTIAPGGPALTLTFTYCDDWRELDSRGRVVELEFGGIRDLKLELPADYDPLAAISLEGITHQEISGISHFDVDMGDVRCSFVADVLTFRE